jgi:hypothetical protein
MLIEYRPWHPDETRKHVLSQVENATVTAVTGEEVELPIGDHEVSLCCHSDSPGAVEIVKAARGTLQMYGKACEPYTDLIPPHLQKSLINSTASILVSLEKWDVHFGLAFRGIAESSM